MLRKRTNIYVLISLIMLILATPAFAEDTYQKWPDQPGVSTDKVWKIKFNIPMLESSISSQNIYVTDQSGSNFPVKVSFDPNDAAHKTVLVEPQEAYQVGSTYTLYILKAVTSQNGQNLKQGISMNFAIAAGNSSQYLFGIVTEVDEDAGNIYVNIAGQGENVRYDYGESWYPYNKASLVMLDKSGNIVPIPDGNLIMDQVWDFSKSKIVFVNHPGAYQVAAGLMIQLIDQSGNLKTGRLEDLTTAAEQGKNARTLVNPDTKNIVIIVIEQ